ncbi:hypothetical protein E6H24_05765 [Candidatus Bathyarchaeota archaeon]|nr:MAG: hypothetical protein E6H24_05765 [Candidatus Bathyarchaeota archaeon]
MEQSIRRAAYEDLDKRGSSTSQGIARVHGLLASYLFQRGFTIVDQRTAIEGQSMTLPWGSYSAYDGTAAQKMDWEDPAQVSKAAAALATFHKLTAAYTHPPDTADSFVQEFLQLLEELRMDLKSLDESSMDLMSGSMQLFKDSLPRVEGLVSDLSYETLPRLFIHGSYCCSNILFQDGELVKIPNLDRSRYEARALDISIALADLTPSVYDAVYLESINTFFSNYDQIQPLESCEEEALPALLMAREAYQALRDIRRIAKIQDQRRKHLQAGKFRRHVSRLDWLEENQESLREIFRKQEREYETRFALRVGARSGRENFQEFQETA